MKKQSMLLSLIVALALMTTYSIAQTNQQQVPGPEQGGSGVNAPTNTDPGPTAPDGSKNPSMQNPANPGDSAPVGKAPTATGTNSGYGDTDTSKGNEDTTSPQLKPNSDTSQNANMSDSELQSAVRSKLSSDPAFSNVQATVENGTVTLDGTVASKLDKKRVKDQVRSVAGVKKVKEHVNVSGSESQAKPSASGSGPGMAMMSEQDAPQSGTADQNTAGSTAGNSQTSANPSSQPPAATAPQAGSMGAGQTGTSPSENTGAAVPQSDSASPTGAGDTLTLQRQIQSAIKSDPSLAQSSVNVNVTDTAIDLEGSVANDSAKTTAERIAQSYAINRKVTNNLQVTGRGNSDMSQGQSSMSNSGSSGSTTSTPSSTGNSDTTGTTPTTDQNTQPQSVPK